MRCHCICRAGQAVAAGFSIAVVASFLPPAKTAAGEADAATREAWRSMSQLGRGFVIWESNRAGHWRLWRRELDGSGPRQISPEEQGREHYCPHLSPDGSRLVYLSYPTGNDTYDHRPGQGMPLYVLPSEGGQPKLIAPLARDYYEDRAAVWLDNDRLVYIDGEGFTVEHDLRTGKNTRLTTRGEKGGNWGQSGWLVNATKTYATGGQPTFSPFDAAQGRVTPQAAQGGCQPYFTHDGRWGFWMGGAGGPINRIDLKTRQVSPMLGANDPRMPKERAYLYFPMVSRDGRFLTFAASPNQHDHFASDYDVFVARLNPQTLEVIDRPVRYTFDAKNDRFPDVHASDLALGQIAGEAPHSVELVVKDSSDEWEWNFGDGQTARGRVAKHVFEKAGEYRIQARRDGRTLHGLVSVKAAAPPKPVAAWLAKPDELIVSFDEPIEIAKLSAKLDSGAGIDQTALSESRRELVLRLKNKLAKDDRLRLSGITDRAQRPNAIAETSLPVSAVAWPATADGLVYVFQTADRPNQVAGADGKQRSYPLIARGRGRLDRNQSLVLTGGAYVVDGAESSLLDACRKTGQLTIEAVVSPDHLKQNGPARIVTFSSNTGERNFTLGQQDDRLILRLRTPSTGLNGVQPEVTLCRLAAGRPQHVAVTYSPGELACYLDGREVYRGRDVQGDFSNWTPQHLLLGDEWDGARDWAGVLEGVALFSRALTVEEVGRDAAQYLSQIKSRGAVPRVVVEAELIARSKPATLNEIKPYRSALVVYKYRIAGQPPAELDGEREIFVSHWSMLDGRDEAVAQLQPGAKARLELEPFDSNPQLKSFVCKDDFDSDADLARRRYYDVRH